MLKEDICLTVLGCALNAQDDVRLDRLIDRTVPTEREFIKLPVAATEASCELQT